MSDKAKKIVSIAGIVVGIAVVIIGFTLQNTSNYSIGESIKFGADFYTEMYDVTVDVGHVINYAINDLVRAMGWLIVSIGAIDICFFAYKFVSCCNITEDKKDTTAKAKSKNGKTAPKASPNKSKKSSKKSPAQGDEYIDAECPECGNMVTVNLSQESIECPWCNTILDIEIE